MYKHTVAPKGKMKWKGPMDKQKDLCMIGAVRFLKSYLSIVGKVCKLDGIMTTSVTFFKIK